MSTSNSNGTTTLATWQRWSIWAFGIPVYLAAISALSRGLFALMLPPMSAYYADWTGGGVGMVIGLRVLINAVDNKVIHNWLTHGVWKPDDKYCDEERRRRY